MAKSMNIRKGDQVVILAGKDKGKEGKVIFAFPEKERVAVEGVNIVKKHQRPTTKQPQGGIMEQEAALHVSNVMLICPGCSKPTRVGRRRDEGGRVRVCKKCGKDIG